MLSLSAKMHSLQDERPLACGDGVDLIPGHCGNADLLLYPWSYAVMGILAGDEGQSQVFRHSNAFKTLVWDGI